MDATLSQLLESIELTPVGGLQSLSGGDIAAVYRLELLGHARTPERAIYS